MMNRLPIGVVLASLVFNPGGLRADAPQPQGAALVSFDELQARLGDPHLRLLDARAQDDYAKGHIPGAVRVDPKAVEDLAKRPGALTDRSAWASWIEALGISPDTTVLIYDAKRQLDAARVWWLLNYIGVKNAGLVDGGFPLWEKEGRPVSTEAPKITPQEFPVAFQANRLATRDQVLEALRSHSGQVLDARTDAEHAGTDVRSKRGGHIPTACHLEWSNLVDPDGRFLPPAELRAKIEKAGIHPDEPVITHCQGGGRASVNAFVLERLGYKTRNYYLGWSDWGNAESTPIETNVKAR